MNWVISRLMPIDSPFIILEADINLAGYSIEDVYASIDGVLVARSREFTIKVSNVHPGVRYITGRVYSKNEAAMVRLVAPYVQFYFPFDIGDPPPM